MIIFWGARSWRGCLKWLICFQFEFTILFTSFIKLSSFECKLFKKVVLNLTICLLSKIMIYFTHLWIKVHLLSENSSRELFWIQYPCSYPKSWFISQVIKWKILLNLKIVKSKQIYIYLFIFLDTTSTCRRTHQPTKYLVSYKRNAKPKMEEANPNFIFAMDFQCTVHISTWHFK